MVIVLVILLGAALLAGGLVALPFLLPSGGAQTALVRGDLVAIFRCAPPGQRSSPASALILTRRYAFRIPHAELAGLPELGAWLGAVGGSDDAHWEPAFRRRLSDPTLSTPAIVEAQLARLPAASVIDLSPPCEVHVITKRSGRGLYIRRPGASFSDCIPIESEADALAARRLLTSG